MPTNLFRHFNGYDARLPDPRLTRDLGLFPHAHHDSLQLTQQWAA